MMINAERSRVCASVDRGSDRRLKCSMSFRDEMRERKASTAAAAAVA